MPETIADQMRTGNTVDKKITAETLNMLRYAIKLAAAVSGNNKTAALIEKKKLRLASPRILSLVPEENENDGLDLLSPSVFSLHNEGKGIEKLLSLPTLINSISNTDHKGWLNFILEASGVTDTLSKIDKDDNGNFGVPYEDFPKGIDGQPMYITKENVTEIGGKNGLQKVEIFEGLQKMLSKNQIDDFNDVGYSIMNEDQLDYVYGKGSPYRNDKAHQTFKSMSKSEIQERVHTNLRDLGTNNHIRKKRLVLSPAVLEWIVLNPAATSQPFILSPVLLTAAVLSPAIFGPVILSPWLFVPVIISPRVMCPVVLSPVALSTVILSPLVMDPLILTPACMVPFVLSPNVLSPNILVPNVMVPSILSPFALSPNVFSPGAVTVVALSPFVLSPNFFSPAYIATLFMSPHAFSPNIHSKGKGVSVILSPSAFS